MHIEIRKVELIEELRKGKNGQYMSREQKALLVSPEDDQVRKFTLRLREDEPAHVVGKYGIDPESLTVDQYGRLTVGVVKLLPLVSPAK